MAKTNFEIDLGDETRDEIPEDDIEAKVMCDTSEIGIKVVGTFDGRDCCGDLRRHFHILYLKRPAAIYLRDRLNQILELT